MSTYDTTTFSPSCPSLLWERIVTEGEATSPSPGIRTHTPVMQQALAAAKEAAHRAGEVILSYYSSHYEVQSKGVDNPVTTADLAANRVLHETLLAAFPEAGWLSEESADDVARLQHDYVWIIDPIDGTKEFIQGLDEFVVVVAFVVQQQVDSGRDLQSCASRVIPCLSWSRSVL